MSGVNTSRTIREQKPSLAETEWLQLPWCGKALK